MLLASRLCSLIKSAAGRTQDSSKAHHAPAVLSHEMKSPAGTSLHSTPLIRQTQEYKMHTATAAAAITHLQSPYSEDAQHTPIHQVIYVP